jgi:DNA-binding MarR family transcriptional regulator
MQKIPTKETIQVWIRLHRAQRLLLTKVEASLKSAGLPPLSWYDVLLELSRKKSDGLRQYEIAERILLRKYNLSRLLDRLETKFLIVRHACKKDGRGIRIKITGKGETLMREMWLVYSESMQENFGSKLDFEETIELDRILRKILYQTENT